MGTEEIYDRKWNFDACIISNEMKFWFVDLFRKIQNLKENSEVLNSKFDLQKTILEYNLFNF